ncbi:hypothetical protein Micbo1qcDRAFT_161096 [Microdochium bolleyi]|uniref:Uncharacterized protein n=1 Tax=Microdochium bolleyi TaxID=196109 RepID=A0A136J7L8_9PEZI|nr:hypothetical protein Micbo1qcDRAFT_161096 [Microdochium bolleyi]
MAGCRCACTPKRECGRPGRWAHLGLVRCSRWPLACDDDSGCEQYGLAWGPLSKGLPGPVGREESVGLGCGWAQSTGPRLCGEEKTREGEGCPSRRVGGTGGAAEWRGTGLSPSCSRLGRECPTGREAIVLLNKAVSTQLLAQALAEIVQQSLPPRKLRVHEQRASEAGGSCARGRPSCFLATDTPSRILQELKVRQVAGWMRPPVVRLSNFPNFSVCSCGLGREQPGDEYRSRKACTMAACSRGVGCRFAGWLA